MQLARLVIVASCFPKASHPVSAASVAQQIAAPYPAVHYTKLHTVMSTPD